MTDNQLMKAEHITAKMAAEYLHLGEQSCRVLARSGKIGEPVPGTNRVIFQPLKMIRYKRGGNDPDEEARAIVRALEEMGLPEIWAKVCLVLKEMYEEERRESA